MNRARDFSGGIARLLIPDARNSSSKQYGGALVSGMGGANADVSGGLMVKEMTTH